MEIDIHFTHEFYFSDKCLHNNFIQFLMSIDALTQLARMIPRTSTYHIFEYTVW